MKKSVSVFRNFVNKVEDKSLEEILNDIKIGKYKAEISDIRHLINNDRKEESDELKKQLTAFTVSGTFNNGRSIDKIENYSQYVILDIDKLSNVQLKEIINFTRLAPYTFASFISPSGKGLKIIVKINTTKEHHKEAYKQVVDYYEQALNIDIDISGSDICRLCFVSFDEEIYINNDTAIFQVDIINEIESNKINNRIEHNNKGVNNTSDYEKFQNCVDFTNNVASYQEGNRNNYIFQLACNCNRKGLNKVETENFIGQAFNLNTSEIKAAVKSAYKNNLEDFAKFAEFANYTNPISKENDNSISAKLEKMPYLPNEIFDQLPDILKEGCSVFSEKRERDVFFTGAISILSGCMSNVSGGYRGKKQYANLFSFVIAPAASGKGSLTYAKDLGIKCHERLVAESKEALREYKIKEQEYKKKLTNKAIDTADLEPPIEPPFKVLYIPANSSSSRVIQHLIDGDEIGIFCETEADSMGNVLKQDWGGYSDLLRKAFQHEPISLSRKTENEFSEIKSPRLSVALAGTPGQVANLIKSAEDGLFSRFLFYSFESEIVWIDANEKMNGVNLTEHFEYLSKKTLDFTDYLNQLNEVDFKLTEHQWKELNDFGKKWLTNLSTFVSQDLAGTVKRLGLILFRVNMILTALRQFDNGTYTNTFICSKEDFKIALSLVETYLKHSVSMFIKLPKLGTLTDKVLKKFFNKLPLKFRRKDAILIAHGNFQIKERTADTYLLKLVEAKYLEKITSGFYQKIK